MATSLSFHKNIIKRIVDGPPGVGRMVKWSVGINPLAKAFEDELKRGDQDSTGLRGSAAEQKEQRVVR